MMAQGENICNLPSQAGPCLGYFTRYYFHIADKECRQFFYGGCGGNANNFVTKEACIKECLN